MSKKTALKKIEKTAGGKCGKSASMIAVTFIIVFIFYTCNCVFMAVNAKKIFERAFNDDFYGPGLEKYISKKAFDYIDKDILMDKELIASKSENIQLLFAVNDIFFNGHIWMKYSFETISREDGKSMHGEHGSVVQLSLERKAGCWQIVNIYDPPY